MNKIAARLEQLRIICYYKRMSPVLSTQYSVLYRLAYKHEAKHHNTQISKTQNEI